MGSWSVNCGISNIAITSGNECCIIPIKWSDRNEIGKSLPFMLPIFGVYNDYGGMEDVVETENTKLIESSLGITIDEFVTFLVDGEYTYDREEASEVKKKLEKNGNYKLVKDLRFMWVDKQVYDLMKVSHDEWYKGYHDLGTRNMANLLGLKEMKDHKVKNYDSKRFNIVYGKGDSIFYSDGKTLLSTENQFIWRIKGEGDNTLDETCFDFYEEVPQELKFLSSLEKHEAWKTSLTKKEFKEDFSFIFGMVEEFGLSETLISILKENPDFAGLNSSRNNKIHNSYFDDLDKFGDGICEIINLYKNMRSMSAPFRPHELYLTPQCGDYDNHQKLLEGFCRINKSYMDKRNG